MLLLCIEEAFLCVLCVSVVQFRTMTVIERGFTTETQRTQRRPIQIEPILANLFHATLAARSHVTALH